MYFLCLTQKIGRMKIMARMEKSMPALVPTAKSNQKTSSGPSVRNGRRPEDGGDYGEGDRVDLAGVGFDVEADVGRFGWSVSLFSHRGGPFDRLRDRCAEEGLVGGEEVDAGYVPLPKFYTFKSRDERERILYKNFVQVGEDVKEMIQEIQKYKVK